jgi:outer membrane biosynthesis protein TonB
MTKAEMYDFEKAMMDDPMLGDAVDGYREAMGRTDSSQDLAELSKQIKAAPAKVVKGSFKQWMSIAAGLIILLSGSVVLYRIFNQKENAVVVQNTELAADTSTAASTQVDSNTVAINEAKPHVIIPSGEPKPVVIPPAAATKEKKSTQKIKLTEPETTNNAYAKEDVTVPEKRPAPAVAKDNVVTRQETATKMPAANTDGYVRLNRFNGKIVDENNNPLPFANITEKKSGVGTYADVNGNFVLLSADSVLNVQTRSLGFVSSTSQIKTNNNTKIVLRDEPAVANAPSAGVLYERNKNRIIRSESDTTAEELEAEPYDGWSNYNLYVNNNMRNPFGNDELDKKSASKAEVQLSFDVNPDGSLTNIKVERSNCKDCNKEAIRLVKEGPKWKSKPGKKGRTKFTVRF